MRQQDNIAAGRRPRHSPEARRALRVSWLSFSGRGARSSGLAAVAAIAILASLALAASSASAAVPVHTHKEVFGSAAEPEFQSPGGIAVDQATEDVYVIDAVEQTLNRYKANGEKAPFAALSGSNVIDGKSGEDQTPQGEILSTEGSPAEAQVAVAPPSVGSTAGDIYVTDAANGKLDIFSSEGRYLGQESFGYPCGVAVNSAGTVFVGSFENEAALYKLEATSPGHLSEVAHFPTPRPCQVAAGFGPAAGSVFVADDLAQAGEIRADARDHLPAAPGGAEAGHTFSSGSSAPSSSSA